VSEFYRRGTELLLQDQAGGRDERHGRILVETDAPFLAPVPYRGKRNEPAYVASTAATLADVKGISTDALAQATTQNVLRLFSKMPPLTEPASA
jgi:TatD DNase family protein